MDIRFVELQQSGSPTPYQALPIDLTVSINARRDRLAHLGLRFGQHSASAMTEDSTPFPTLDFTSPEEWEWAAPPLAWRHVPAPSNGIPQPCSIVTVSGETVHGEMFNFDPTAGNITFRSTVDSPRGLLGFSSIRRLTLLDPLRAAPQGAGEPSDRLPVVTKIREYVLHSSDTGQAPMTGRTAGHVEIAAGLYLFTPVEDDTALQRVFVPRSAYSSSEFGPSAEEVAARLWINSPKELIEAIDRQQKMRVQPIGQSLLALGLMTQAQLDSALARPTRDRPLGESLVANGAISHSDLQTALAHKMGYPLVDLTRFPVDPAALAMVPPDVAERYRVMPLIVDKGRLIVAVDKPSRVDELRSLHFRVQTSIVPVLAPGTQITVAVERLSRGVWLHRVDGRTPLALPPR